MSTLAFWAGFAVCAGLVALAVLSAVIRSGQISREEREAGLTDE